jgi:hypothetical protein
VFGDSGTHHGRDRRFLKRICADGVGRNLTAYYDNRSRIGHAITHRGDGIRCPRTGCDYDDPDLAAGTGITCSHEARTLFVSRDDQRHWQVALLILMIVVVAKNRVIGGQNCTAAIAKNGVNAFIGQNLDDHLGSGHAFSGKRVVHFINCR